MSPLRKRSKVVDVHYTCNVYEAYHVFHNILVLMCAVHHDYNGANFGWQRAISFPLSLVYRRELRDEKKIHVIWEGRSFFQFAIVL